MTRRSFICMILLGTMITFSACGGGGGGGGGTPPPTKAVVTLATAGTPTTIGIVQVRLVLPAGVSVRATNTVTDSDVVAASGSAAGAELAYGVYSSPAVTVVIGKSAGFSVGEFATVNCDLASAVQPAATDFSLSGLDVRGLGGKPVSGLTATLSVTLP